MRCEGARENAPANHGERGRGSQSIEVTYPILDFPPMYGRSGSGIVTLPSAFW